MLVKKRPAAATPPPACQALAIREAGGSALGRALANCGTKTGLVDALKLLTEHGFLSGEFLRSGASLKRDLSVAQREHADAKTPYGRVLKTLQLPGGVDFEYACPFALLHHLTVLSDSFAAIMERIVEDSPAQTLTFVIYVDEMNPGNPYRPEKSRCLQCVYWVFAEFPEFLLSRTAAWPSLGFLKSSNAEELEGYMSEFMGYVLKIFLPEDERKDSFARGVLIATPGGKRICLKASFGGFLADMKALTEIFCFKGASGVT